MDVLLHVVPGFVVRKHMLRNYFGASICGWSCKQYFNLDTRSHHHAWYSLTGDQAWSNNLALDILSLFSRQLDRTTKFAPFLSLLCTTCQHTSTFLYVAFIGRTKLILLLLYNALMLETHHVRCEQRIAYRDTYLWFSFLHKIECSAFRSRFCVWHQADWQVLELRTK
jgi:hypothetical protein